MTYLKLVLVLSLFCSAIGFSQRSFGIEEVYYDETGKKISQEQFNNKLNYDYNLPKTFMNDSLIVRMLISRETYGTISKEHEEQFRDLLQKTTSDTNTKDKTIIINYFYEHQNCLDTYKNDRSYLRKIDKNEELVQYFITDRTFNYESEDPKVYRDAYDIVRRLFFRYEFVCGNYVIIKPDGQYYRYYGEYDQSEIVKKATSNWVEVND